MLTELQDPRIRAILSRTGDDRPWRGELERLARGDLTLTRRSVGEGAIRAVQRLLIFLGYSTSSTGAFTVDGDFGRGTNRGIAQFQFEHGLTRAVDRQTLCYPCSFQTARKEITAIPDVTLDLATAKRLLERAVEAADANRVTFGRFDDALFHLNCLEEGRYLGCREIAERYGAAADAAGERVEEETGVRVRREWILAIIRQETAGVCRPRFEQHKLSKLNADAPGMDFGELRFQSMSLGLGQIMGFNHRAVGAPSAQAMLTAPAEDQVLYVARFLAPKRSLLARKVPSADDFRAVARYYNGPAYEAHFYHEKLETWFREFRSLA